MSISLMVQYFVLCIIVESKKVNNGSERSKGTATWTPFERIKNTLVPKNISESGCSVIIFLSLENHAVISFISLTPDKKVESRISSSIVTNIPVNKRCPIIMIMLHVYNNEGLFIVFLGKLYLSLIQHWFLLQRVY